VGLPQGIYLNTTSATPVNYVTANLTAAVNFASGSINFSTGNSASSNSIVAPNMTPNSGLDMIGVLTINSGTNSFSGTVTNSLASQMQGTASENFMAPQHRNWVVSLL
jgi:hypothetical protein